MRLNAYFVLFYPRELSPLQKKIGWVRLAPLKMPKANHGGIALPLQLSPRHRELPRRDQWQEYRRQMRDGDFENIDTKRGP